MVWIWKDFFTVAGRRASLRSSEVISANCADWLRRVRRCARVLLAAVMLGVRGGQCGLERAVRSLRSGCRREPTYNLRCFDRLS